MKEPMRNRTILFVALFLGCTSWSQKNDDVIIISNVNRPVEPAYRMAGSPKIIDTIMPTLLTVYPLLSLQKVTTIQLEKIAPAVVKLEPKLPQLYHTYIKAGIGSTLMPLGEIFFDGTRSRKYMYGAHLKHVSSFGKITGYAPAQFDRNAAKIFGGINEKNYTLLGDLHYNNKGFHYYAVQNDSLHRDSIVQRFSDAGATFSFASHQKDSANFNYNLGITYNNYLSKKPLEDSLSRWRAQENYFALNSVMKYKLGKEVFSADLNVTYNGYKYGISDSSLNAIDTGIVVNNTIISLKPTITTFAKNNRFKAQIGVDLTLDVQRTNRFYIYPAAEVKYSLFNDMFIPYAGIKGGLKQNTFKSLTQQNEFLLPNIVLQNENTAVDLYLGFKGTLSKRISFNVSGSFAHVNNKALFVTDTLYSLGNKFNVIFDTLNVTTIEGSLSYQLVEKLKIDAIGRYYSYALNNNSYAWNLPQWQLITRGSYNLYDKFFVNLDLDFEGGRKALVYAMEEGVTVEDMQMAKTLGFVADANLGVEYRYNKRVSAFLQCNNVAAQRYKRWYNAPVQGFQVMGGVTFRF
jgi:hypothetical protein